MILFGALQVVMPPSNAYCLAYLLIVFTVSLSAYIYILYIIKDRWVSTLGAVIFGLCPFVVGHAQHPEIDFIATIPLSLYCFHRGTVEHKRALILISGVLVGFTAYIGMYIFVCLLLAICMYICYFVAKNWREPHFWLALALFVSLIGFIGAPRIYPFLRDATVFDEVMEKTLGRETGTDLIEYFVNTKHPWAGHSLSHLLSFGEKSPFLLNTSYLGYTVLALILIGIVRKSKRRQMFPRLLLAIPFLVLRLGSFLTVGGKQFSDFVLPKHVLDELVPGVFEAFHATDHFQMGALLPIAILACYGAQALTRYFSPRKGNALVLFAIILISFEYSQVIELTVVSDDEIAFLEWMKSEPDSVRLINLSMGRQNAKIYSFHQTLSGFPHVEGLASRTPSSAYNYIRRNLLLNTWHENRPLSCAGDADEEYLSALDDLRSDGFSHIILHSNEENANNIIDSFRGANPSFRDGFLSIFRLGDLRDSCRTNATSGN